MPFATFDLGIETLVPRSGRNPTSCLVPSKASGINSGLASLLLSPSPGRRRVPVHSDYKPIPSLTRRKQAECQVQACNSYTEPNIINDSKIDRPPRQARWDACSDPDHSVSPAAIHIAAICCIGFNKQKSSDGSCSFQTRFNQGPTSVVLQRAVVQTALLPIANKGLRSSPESTRSA